ncbi:MAG: hypothetical protein BEN18_05665 [Epulopiscium sp. Nuni2H_MBin001]|nr:MAG: hypothetical protein BEN18_05665 [Epulopiscium sp. Nuni2H_MBin001]
METTIVDEIGEYYLENELGIYKGKTISKAVEQGIIQKIKYLLCYDQLTALPNRQMFSVYCKQLKGNSFTAILIDIAKFKQINVVYGDKIGDLVLVDIAERLSHIVSQVEGVVIRYSGNEFMLLLKEGSVSGTIENFYNKKVLPLISLVYSEQRPIYMQFNSVAITYPNQSCNMDDMLTKMYVMIRESKERNVEELLEFDPRVYEKYIREESIKNKLQAAIKADEFILFYQPIVDANQKICKAEALIRWVNEELGFVSPIDFISIAESTHIIVDLGYWIIERASKDLSYLFSRGEEVQISINISPVQLMEDSFVEKAKHILDKHNIDYKYICFEITESILLQERGIVINNIRKLQDMGITMALDDFGTGYSAFSYLKEYNLDILKIDKAFVDDPSEKTVAVVQGMYQIAQALDMQVIIEGVETQDQFNKFKKFGLIQGYFFSKPLAWPDFIRKLGS